MKTWLITRCNDIVTAPDSNTAVWTKRMLKKRFRVGVALVAGGCYTESRRFGRSFRSASECKVGGLGRTMNETKLMTDGTQTLGDVVYDVTYKTTDERPKF